MLFLFLFIELILSLCAPLSAVSRPNTISKAVIDYIAPEIPKQVIILPCLVCSGSPSPLFLTIMQGLRTRWRG